MILSGREKDALAPRESLRRVALSRANIETLSSGRKTREIHSATLAITRAFIAMAREEGAE